jgi:hypothetical protein
MKNPFQLYGLWTTTVPNFSGNRNQITMVPIDRHDLGIGFEPYREIQYGAACKNAGDQGKYP